MNRSINPLSVFLLASFALLLSSCSEKINESIIGQWRVEKDGTIVDYRPDGTFSFSGNNVIVKGTYKFTDDSHLTLEIPNVPPKGATVTSICSVQFSGDTLEMDSIIKAPGQPDQKDHNRLTRVKQP